MTIALCLGGASSVQCDWAAALELFEPDFVVACNDVGAIWPGRLDAWVTLHPEKLGVWRDQRRANGYPDAGRYLVHGDHPPEWADLAEFRFPGQGDSGSSGLFAAKAALLDLGADRAVLAGIPLGTEAHFFDAQPWSAANEFRAIWGALLPEYRARIRSMSGWTAQSLGSPSTEWLLGIHDASALTPTKEPVMTSSKLTKIAYEPHPVPFERKRELNAQGFKVLDARFAPVRDPLDHDGDGRKGGSPKPEGGDDLDAARAKYLEVVGKRPFHGWDIATLNAKIAEAGKQDEETASNGLTRREICADLEALQVEFDPADVLEDLAALRDLAREERNV